MLRVDSMHPLQSLAVTLPSWFAHLTPVSALTQPGITGYVMITAGASAFVGSRGSIDFAAILHIVLGTGIATAGALALNQYVERDFDALMTRTKGRPLPSGRLSPVQGLAAATVLLVGGTIYLALSSGLRPAAIAAASAIAYLTIYTPLKRQSYIATLAGAVPGALPTLIGWTAATRAFEPAGLALFGIAYLWQLPHVLGLAWMLRDDYAKVGFKLIPEGGGRVIGLHMVLATAVLLPASLSPTFLGYTGTWYATGAFILSTGFLLVSATAGWNMTDNAARGVFFSSLLYHPLLLSLMVFDTVSV